jgi:peptidoglycan-associated lipoprotein
MRKSAIVVALVATSAAFGCGKKPPKATPPPPVAPATPPPAPQPARDVVPQQSEYDRIKAMSTDEIEKLGLLAEIHFDFDRSDIREGDRQILAKNAEVLKKFDFLKLSVEGHCDERGSVEYNLALGERRARAAMSYLVSKGVDASRISMVSYGKERPVCTQKAEACWARNRRAHFLVKPR